MSLSLLSCAPDAAWHGSTSFTEAERTAIEEGHTWVCDHIKQSCAPIVWDRAPEDRSRETIVRDDSLVEAGHCDRGSATIYIRPSAPFTRGVAAHEFGHWFGLEHTRDGFMAPSTTTDDLRWPSDM